MYADIIMGIVMTILVIGSIISGVVYLIRRFVLKRNPLHPADQPVQIFSSQEDALSQCYFLLATAFLGVTLLVANWRLNEPLSWQTVFLITAAIGLGLAYYYHLVLVKLFSTVAIVIWWPFQAQQWVEKNNINGAVLISGLGLISLLLYCVGRFLEKKEKFSKFAFVDLGLGLFLSLGLMFILSSQLGLEMLDDLSDGELFWHSGKLIFLVLITTLALIFFLASLLYQRAINWLEETLLLGLSILFGVLLFFPPLNLAYGGYNDLTTEGLFWALVFNLALFLEMLGIIFIGYYRKETWLINLGALALFLFILIKYFDWFFTFMDKSVFFIGAGGLLFVVGWFMEKGRRLMLENLKNV